MVTGWQGLGELDENPSLPLSRGQGVGACSQVPEVGTLPHLSSLGNEPQMAHSRHTLGLLGPLGPLGPAPWQSEEVEVFA